MACKQFSLNSAELV